MDTISAKGHREGLVTFAGEVITSPKRAFVAAIVKRHYAVDSGAMTAELNEHNADLRLLIVGG